MKQQAIQYVALDVHQATVVVSVRDEQGSVVMRATVATEAKTIIGLVRGLGTLVQIVFEEGTQAQWLHDVLKPHAERVIVCNTRGGTQQERPHRRRPAVRVAASGSAEERVSRSELAADVEGTGEELHQSGRRRDASDAADQSAVPSARHPDAGGVSVSAIEAQRMAGPARGARGTDTSRRAAGRAGCAAGAPPEGEGGDDRRGTPAARMENPAIDPVPRFGFSAHRHRRLTGVLTKYMNVL